MTGEQPRNSRNGKADHLKDHQWKKGVSGNPSGRPKGSISLEAELRKRLNNGEEGEKIVEGLVTRALRSALNGDWRFFNMILERVDGKVADRIAGHDGGPIFSDQDLEGIQHLLDSTDRWKD
jgi:hypothetical protein